MALPPSSIMLRNWGRSAILPLSASSTYGAGHGVAIVFGIEGGFYP